MSQQLLSKELTTFNSLRKSFKIQSDLHSLKHGISFKKFWAMEYSHGLSLEDRGIWSASLQSYGQSQKGVILCFSVKVLIMEGGIDAVETREHIPLWYKTLFLHFETLTYKYNLYQLMQPCFLVSIIMNLLSWRSNLLNLDEFYIIVTSARPNATDLAEMPLPSPSAPALVTHLM